MFVSQTAPHRDLQQNFNMIQELASRADAASGYMPPSVNSVLSCRMRESSLHLNMTGPDVIWPAGLCLSSTSKIVGGQDLRPRCRGCRAACARLVRPCMDEDAKAAKAATVTSWCHERLRYPTRQDRACRVNVGQAER